MPSWRKEVPILGCIGIFYAGRCSLVWRPLSVIGSDVFGEM